MGRYIEYNGGGEVLRPNKSYWHMIDYKYIGNKWIYKLIKQLPGTITVKAADGTRQTIMHLELK